MLGSAISASYKSAYADRSRQIAKAAAAVLPSDLARLVASYMLPTLGSFVMGLCRTEQISVTRTLILRDDPPLLRHHIRFAILTGEYIWGHLGPESHEIWILTKSIEARQWLGLGHWYADGIISTTDASFHEAIGFAFRNAFGRDEYTRVIRDYPTLCEDVFAGFVAAAKGAYMPAEN
jgi:hypothetical protein